jgi:hypothetical protein
MTWIEFLMIVSAVALIGAVFVRPIRSWRAIQIVAGVTLVIVLAIFGREFVSDLF